MAVQFIDIVDSSIMNVALPSIRDDLGFSQQRLQWVLSGYLVTYGGFLLLGGRAADLLGRRRLLVAGTTLFAACSLVGGLATDAEVLVGARVVQGVGAALMAPAGLSILTTTFTGARPCPGARRLGRDQRRRRGSRGVPRRRPVRRTRLALGAAGQHPDLPRDRRRRLRARARGRRRAGRRSTSPGRSSSPPRYSSSSTGW